MVEIESEEALRERYQNDTEYYDKLEMALLNKNGQYTLPEQFRALFTLKSLSTPLSVQIISKSFQMEKSVLLKHELAYCLGQMGLKCANDTLASVLANTSEDPMVRHEAAEALGAIGSESSIAILSRYLSADQEREVVVRETCQLAIEKITHDLSFANSDKNGQNSSGNIVYQSVDPAPAFHDKLDDEQQQVEQLRECLLDEDRSLFERYRAMFTLRNIGTEEAVRALGDGLLLGKSALFRHEVAFVFGQMQHPASVGVLQQVLAKAGEMDMVRHECAEALGSIATPECLSTLMQYIDNKNNDNSDGDDKQNVVRESCEVAVDMWKYENDPSLFNHTLTNL